MRTRFPWLPFLTLLAAGAAFVEITSARLPEVVAAHFSAAGTADGFMPRATYVHIMLGMLVGVPLLLALLPLRAINAPTARINLPHADYWLSPPRRAATAARLVRYAAGFAVSVEVFLCYGHALVVRANEATPARLSTAAMLGGLLTFLALQLFALWRLIRAFTRVPGPPDAAVGKAG